MALYRAMCRCNLNDEKLSSSQRRALIACRAHSWPYGYHLIKTTHFDEIRVRFISHYDDLSRAYNQAAPGEQSHLLVIPKDMQNAIDDYLTSVRVTNRDISICRLGAKWAPSNIPYELSFGEDGRITFLRFREFAHGDTVGTAIYHVETASIVHRGQFASGINYEYTLYEYYVKPEVFAEYMKIINAGFNNFRSIVHKYTGISVRDYKS